MSRTLCLLFLAFTAIPVPAADWPMWRYDVERTAECPQKLPADLALLWQRDLPKPLPAFDDVRLQFDGGYEPIVSGQRLFLSSNCEDKVTAYDNQFRSATLAMLHRGTGATRSGGLERPRPLWIR